MVGLLYVKLKLPYGILEEISIEEIYYLAKAYYDTQRESMELFAFSVFHATRYAQSKEKQYKNPFAVENTQPQTQSISEEERQETLEALGDIF